MEERLPHHRSTKNHEGALLPGHDRVERGSDLSSYRAAATHLRCLAEQLREASREGPAPITPEQLESPRDLHGATRRVIRQIRAVEAELEAGAALAETIDQNSPPIAAIATVADACARVVPALREERLLIAEAKHLEHTLNTVREQLLTSSGSECTSALNRRIRELASESARESRALLGFGAILWRERIESRGRILQTLREAGTALAELDEAAAELTSAAYRLRTRTQYSASSWPETQVSRAVKVAAVRLAEEIGEPRELTPPPLDQELRNQLVERFTAKEVRQYLLRNSFEGEALDRAAGGICKAILAGHPTPLDCGAEHHDSFNYITRKGLAFVRHLESSVALIEDAPGAHDRLAALAELRLLTRLLDETPGVWSTYELEGAIERTQARLHKNKIPTEAHIGLVKEVVVEGALLPLEESLLIDTVLAAHVTGWMITQQDRHDESAGRGRDTLVSYDPEIVPYAILNALRLRAYHCDRPLLSGPRSGMDSPLEEYLARMPEEVKAVVAERWGPEVGALMGRITTAFSTLRAAMDAAPGERWIDECAFGESLVAAVAPEAARVACRLLAEPPGSLDIVPIELLPMVKWSPGPSEEATVQALADRSLHYPGQRYDSLLEVVLDHSTTGMGRALTDSLARKGTPQERDEKKPESAAACAVLGHWDRSPTPAELTLLSDCLGLSSKQIRSTIEFLQELRRAESSLPFESVAPDNLMALLPGRGGSDGSPRYALPLLAEFADLPGSRTTAELLRTLDFPRTISGNLSVFERFTLLARDPEGVQVLVGFAREHPEHRWQLLEILRNRSGQERVLAELRSGSEALKAWMARYEELGRRTEALQRTLGYSSVPRITDPSALIARPTPVIDRVLSLGHPERFKLCLAPSIATIDPDLVDSSALRRTLPADHRLVREEAPSRLLITQMQEIPEVTTALLANRLRQPGVISHQEGEDLLACLAICNSLPREHLIAPELITASAAGTPLAELRQIAVRAAVAELQHSFPVELLERYDSGHPAGLAPFVDVVLQYQRSLQRFDAAEKLGALKAVALIELLDGWASFRAQDTEFIAAVRAQVERSLKNLEERKGAIAYLTGSELPTGLDPATLARFHSSFAPASYVVREHAIEDDLAALEHSLSALFEGGHLEGPVAHVVGLTGAAHDGRLLAARWQAAQLFREDPHRVPGTPAEAAVHAELLQRPEESFAARIEGLQREIEASQITARTARLFLVLRDRSRTELGQYQDALAAQRDRLLAHHEVMTALGIDGDRGFGLRVRRAELGHMRLRAEAELMKSDSAMPTDRVSALIATISETEAVLKEGIKLTKSIADRAELARRELDRLRVTVEEVIHRSSRGDDQGATLAWAVERHPGLRGVLAGRGLSRDELEPLLATTALEDLRRLSTTDDAALLAGPRSVRFTGVTSFVDIQRALVGQCLDYRSHRNSVGNSIHTLSYQDPDRIVIVGRDAEGGPCLNGLVFLTRLTSPAWSGTALVVDKAYVPNGQGVSGDLERALFRFVADQAGRIGVPVFIPSADTQATLRFTDMEVMAGEVGARALVTEATVLMRAGPSGSTYSEIRAFESYPGDKEVTVPGFLLIPAKSSPESR